MKIKLLSIIVISMIAVLGIAGVAAYQNGFGGFNLSEEEKAEIQEQRQSMQEAIENNDYVSWETLMQERIATMQGRISEENFQQIRERHEQMSEFKTAIQEAIDSGEIEKNPESIKTFMEENGFEFPEKGFGKMKGFRIGFKMGSHSCPFADSE